MRPGEDLENGFKDRRAIELKNKLGQGERSAEASAVNHESPCAENIFERSFENELDWTSPTIIYLP